MKIVRIIKIVAIIILTISLIIGVYFILKIDVKQKEIKVENICEKINESKDKKETFLIIIKNEYSSNLESIDAIDNFKKIYKNSVIIYELNHDILSNKCFETLFDETGTYQLLLGDNSVVSIFGYKQGIYSGMLQNETNEYGIEEYLVNQEIITKKEIKEDITYNDYVNNSKGEDYILLVISNEDVKEEVASNMKQVFPDITQNTINKRSEVGKQILDNLETKTEVLNVYPQVFYFKNGKIIKNKKVFSTKSFTELKTELKSIE